MIILFLKAEKLQVFQNWVSEGNTKTLTLVVGNMVYNFLGSINGISFESKDDSVISIIELSINVFEEIILSEEGLTEQLIDAKNVIFLPINYHPCFKYRGKTVSVISCKCSKKDFLIKILDKSKCYIIHTITPIGEEFNIRYAEVEFDGIKEFKPEDYIERKENSYTY